MTHVKSMKLKILVIVAVVVLLPINIYLLKFIVDGLGLSDERFATAYETIQFGDSTEAVVAIMGRPVYVFRLKEFQIYYYRPEVRQVTEVQVDIDSSIESLADLPDSYGYVQLLFDPEGKLVARTQIGESYFVETLFGDFKGSHLSRIDSEAWIEMLNNYEPSESNR